MKIQVIDNTRNEEGTEESDKNITTWGAVVKYKGRYDKDATFNVRFDPELYNLTCESTWDYDYYRPDENSEIYKATTKVEEMIKGVRMEVLADSPRYGSGRHFRFKNEHDAITFVVLVNNLMSNQKSEVA